MLFYILDTRSVVGNCGVWWRADRNGYTCDLTKAGRYGEGETKGLRPTDIALPCDEVDALAVQHVRTDTPAFRTLLDTTRDV